MSFTRRINIAHAFYACHDYSVIDHLHPYENLQLGMAQKDVIEILSSDDEIQLMGLSKKRVPPPIQKAQPVKVRRVSEILCHNSGRSR